MNETLRAQAGLPARSAAVEALRLVLDRRKPLEEALESPGIKRQLSLLDERDRSYAMALVLTALRRLGQIDAALSELIAKPLPERAGPAAHVLRIAAAALVFLETPPHAAVNSAVEIAGQDGKARHFRGLINAALRRLADRAAAIRTSDPAPKLMPLWLANRWREANGEERAAEIIRAHTQEPPLDLTLKPGMNAEAWAARLGGHILPTGTLRLERAGKISELPGFADGAWWVQDAAAALPARLLGDVRGLRVLDLCAAPGGKTAWLSAAGAEVTAVDKSKERLARLEENLTRLQLEAKVIEADARDFATDAPFDAILLDAPCTSTGTIRRHPDIAWIKEADDIRALSLLQAELLEHAFSILKPGGHLVYSVCSLEPEEGEAIAEEFLARNPSAARDPVEQGEIPGTEGFITPKGELRTTPADWPGIGGLDGFFAVRLRRT